MGEVAAVTRTPASPVARRLLTVLAVAACAEFGVLELVGVAVGATPGPLLPAVLLTAAYLPPFLRIVLAVLRGRRLRGAWWHVVVIAAALVVSVPLLGPHTLLPVFPALAVSSVLLVPRRWAVPVVLGLAAATVPLARSVDVSVVELWYPTEVAWLATLVALVAAVRRLEQARGDLADHALVRERLRIDDRLRTTVGAALADLLARGERIVGDATLRGGDERTRAELAELVTASRRTLADARALVRGFRRPSLRAELETAAALLGAAGRPVRVDLPESDPPPGADEQLRRDLQAVITSLLGGGADGPVVLRVARDPARSSGYRLVVGEADGAPAAAGSSPAQVPP